MEVPDIYYAYQDEQKCYYYFNARTEETTYSRPISAMVLDPETKRPFRLPPNRKLGKVRLFGPPPPDPHATALVPDSLGDEADGAPEEEDPEEDADHEDHANAEEDVNAEDEEVDDSNRGRRCDVA
jgi:hypothetical protein